MCIDFSEVCSSHNKFEGLHGTILKCLIFNCIYWIFKKQYFKYFCYMLILLPFKSTNDLGYVSCISYLYASH